MKSKRGSIEYLSSLMLICLTGVLMFYVISVKHIKLYQIKIKDSIDTSALSAAIIDIDKLVDDGVVMIENPLRSRVIFEETLKYSLNLDDDFIPAGDKPYGQIVIHDFIVYSVIDGPRLIRYDIGRGGRYTVTEYDYGDHPRTPDGKLIESATIYADVGMYVTGFFGITRYEHIRTSVDVVKDSEEQGDDI